jgi:UDP-GlcNAc:undecaprenyl-phosphate GlcNAc-1-phosphate transferase
MALTAGGILLLRPIAVRINLVDAPGGRKNHRGKVPLLGGIAMFLALVLSYLAAPWHEASLAAFLLSAGLLVAVGIWDDWRGISAWARLLAQAIAVLGMIYLAGISLHNLGNLFGEGAVILGWSAVPFTLFAVIGVINAVNMNDGADGLAGGVTLIALAWFNVADKLAGGAPLADHTVMLAGAVAGFLLFNFRLPWRHRSSVFMGDSGSMLLGLALGWTAIALSQRGEGAMTPITAVWILGLPLIDTVSVMLRRVLAGHNPFWPGREYLHHLLQDAGLSLRHAILVLYGLALACGLIGVVGWQLGTPDVAMLVVFLAVFICHFVLTTRYAKQKQSEKIRAKPSAARNDGPPG